MGRSKTQQWKCTVENRCEFWHSSLAKNLTDNKIWKTIPRGGGKLSGGEGKRRGCASTGAGVCGRASVGCRAWLRFPASAVSTLSPAPRRVFASRCCSPPCNRRDVVRPRNRSWRHPPCARTVPTLQHMEPANTTPSLGAG